MLQIKSFLATSIVKILGCLSLSAARYVGVMLGWVSYALSTRMVKVTRQNIDICLPDLPESERAKLTLRSVLETGKLAAEMCVVWANDYEWVKRHIKVDETNRLTNAYLREGKGLLVLAPHLGNWEVLGMHLPSLGPTTSLYQSSRLEGLDKYVLGARQRSGSVLVPASRKGLSSVVNSLKKGGISCVLPDQIPKNESSGIFAPFFGKPAFTMTLAHKLICKTECKVLFAVARRTAKGFEIMFHEPSAAIYSDDPDIAVTALNQGVESCVLEIPSQYQWEYKRFKKQPAGETSRYFY